MNIESRILTLSRFSEISYIKREEADVYRCPLDFEVASCGFSLKMFNEYKKLAKWADVIHFHFPWPFADILKLTSNIKKPTVVTYHSDIIRQKHLIVAYVPIMHLFLNKVDRIIATSSNYLNSSNVLSKYKEKVTVIPIGINEGSYPKTDNDILDRYQSQLGNNFFLFIGMLRYYKGLHILMHAARDASFEVVVAGTGPEEDALKQLAIELNLKNVKFLGYISDQEKVALLKLAKCIVFPSSHRSEAFGVTLVEGAMFGKPLISTEIGTGTSFINLDGESGFVIPPGNANELRSAMEKIHTNEKVATLMGNKSYERYKNYFTGVKMAEKYSNVYHEVFKK